MNPMKTTTMKLVATKNGETITAEVRTFKQLSKLHHKLERQGWTVSLPL